MLIVIFLHRQTITPEGKGSERRKKRSIKINTLSDDLHGLSLNSPESADKPFDRLQQLISPNHAMYN